MVHLPISGPSAQTVPASSCRRQACALQPRTAKYDTKRVICTPTTGGVWCIRWGFTRSLPRQPANEKSGGGEGREERLTRNISTMILLNTGRERKANHEKVKRMTVKWVGSSPPPPDLFSTKSERFSQGKVKYVVQGGVRIEAGGGGEGEGRGVSREFLAWRPHTNLARRIGSPKIGLSTLTWTEYCRGTIRNE